MTTGDLIDHADMLAACADGELTGADRDAAITAAWEFAEMEIKRRAVLESKIKSAVRPLAMMEQIVPEQTGVRLARRVVELLKEYGLAV